MRSAPHSRSRLACAAWLLCAVAWLVTARGARAEGFSGQIEPRVSHTETRQTDQAGATSSTTTDAFLQRYRLGWDRSFTPRLRLSTSAIIEDVRGWTTSSAGLDVYNRTTAAGYHGSLDWGTPVLGAGIGADRRRFGVPGSVARVNDTARLTFGWNPEELPKINLHLTRSERYDESRAFEDLTTIEAALTSNYRPSKQLHLDYSVRYGNPVDRKAHSESHDIMQTGRVAFTDSFFDKRATVSASYALASRESRTYFSQPGELATVVSPVAGLSAVETFPATPDRMTLSPNGGLIDGETTRGAAVNIGFAATAAGDTARRHVGVDLGLAQDVVNTLFVYVDQPLTPELALAYRWTAWQSRDNVEWTPVPLARPVSFDPFLARFEIRVSDVTAQYVKLATNPLPVGATLDQQFANVFVNEVQVSRVTPVPVGTQTLSARTGTANTSTVLRVARGLTLDSSLFASHAETLRDPTWSAVNGASYARQLNRTLRLGSRVQRSDMARGPRRDSQLSYSSTLGADIFPTLQAGLAYSGQTSWFPDGRTQTNTFSILSTSELYTGVSLAGNAAYGFGTSPLGRTTGLTFNASLAVQPHPRFSTTTNYGFSRSRLGERARLSQQRLDVNGAWTPWNSLSANAGVSRVTGDLPNTTGNLGLSWSPLSGGRLQLGFSYGRTLDTLNDGSTDTLSSSLRWNLRARTFFEVNYVYTRSSDAVQQGTGQSLNAGFVMGI